MEAATTTGATAASDGVAKKRLPTSAWLVYLAEHREEVQTEHPGVAFTEITKIMGERYRQLDPDTKNQLAAVAEANRAIVREEKAQAKEKLPAVVAEKYSSMEVTIPVTRVKRIVQLDPDVARISGDAALLVTKAAEYFLEQLALNVAQFTTAGKRKTTKIEDITDAIHSRNPYAFLRWDFPKTVVKKRTKKDAEMAAASNDATPATKQKSSRLKAYFMNGGGAGQALAAPGQGPAGDAAAQPAASEEHDDNNDAGEEETVGEEQAGEELSLTHLPGLTEIVAESELEQHEETEEAEEEAEEEVEEEEYEETSRKKRATNAKVTKQRQDGDGAQVSPVSRSKKQRT